MAPGKCPNGSSSIVADAVPPWQSSRWLVPFRWGCILGVPQLPRCSSFWCQVSVLLVTVRLDQEGLYTETTRVDWFDKKSYGGREV